MSTEEKITHCLLLMKEELGNEKGPNFKRFWEVRKECLELFKENLSHPLRNKLWENYLTLADEARVARDYVEEDSKFVKEQLDLAIGDFEKQMASFFKEKEQFLASQKPKEYPTLPKAMKEAAEELVSLQKEVDALTLFAAKSNELRKELITLVMPSRDKAKFFGRLTSLGDQIFPLRKELTAEISRRFMMVVDHFVENHFSSKNNERGGLKKNLFFLREEIKGLQAFGKFLSLHTEAFSSVRTKLSSCWDQLKGLEKEVKKEFSEQKVRSAENVCLVRKKIKSCTDKEELSLEELAKEIGSIEKFMRGVRLLKADVKLLQEELAILSEPLREEERIKKQEKIAKAAEETKKREEIYTRFLDKVSIVATAIERGELEGKESTIDAYRKELQSLGLTKSQKQKVQSELHKAKDLLTVAEEKKLLSLSPEDQDARALLQSALHEKIKERKESKERLEEYRKKKGGTALGFQQALEIEELMDNEREQLAKIESLIQDLETKVSKIN